MPSFGQIVRGTGGAALTGFAIGGPPGAIVGGALGALASILEGSPEQERQQRWRQYQEDIARFSHAERAGGWERIAKLISGQTASGRKAALARAKAAGRADEAESYILPVESNIAAQGARALEAHEQNVGAFYNRALAMGALDFANRPIEAPASETMWTLGTGAANYMLDKEMIDALKGSVPDIRSFDRSGPTGLSAEGLPTPRFEAPTNLEQPGFRGIPGPTSTTIGDILGARKRGFGGR
jgi:hypothetical protein